jgi:uncharacterized NAD(P)/FAD-binding protein YdhS
MSGSADVDVVVIGAGASGLLTAIHLLRMDRATRLALIDPRPACDVGIAYSTTDPGHLMNVRSRDLSVFPAEPRHFMDWLAARSGTADPDEFVSRPTYGRYLRDVLATIAADHPLQRFQRRASALTTRSGGVEVALDDGTRVLASHAVLALGHAVPAPSPHPRHISDPWGDDALQRIGLSDEVILIGTGLTAIDVIVSLVGRGHRGPITAVSTTGQWPTSHVTPATLVAPQPSVRPGMSVGEAWHAVRAAVAAVDTSGGDWRGVIDGLRPVTPEIWRAWSDVDRRQFVRLVRSHWDRHRHRIAPSVARDIADLEAAGSVRRVRGRVVGVESDATRSPPDRLAVALSGRSCLTAEWVVVCTGPSPRIADRRDPLIEVLLRQGTARAGWGGWGLDVDGDGRVVDAAGTPNGSIHAIGPLRIGAEWESIAIPELRRQAAHIAERLARQLHR